MIPILIILLGCIIYFIGKNTPEKETCKYSNLKPTVFDNLTNLLLSPEHINNAFSGKEPIIVKNMMDFCYPSIEEYVEKDKLYVETFYNTTDNIIYKHFGDHFTLHAINNYSKKYSSGDIFHKDQLIPYTYWFKKNFPLLLRWMELQNKHIVCSCKSTRKVIIMNDVCSDKILKDNDNLHDLTFPEPIYIKNITKVLPLITSYDFTLNENDCLLFNPLINFHQFGSTDENIAQIHFFTLGKFSKYANYYPYIPIDKDKNELLKQTQNRNVFKYIHTESELIKNTEL
jgi:hypothetical protein